MSNIKKIGRVFISKTVGFFEQLIITLFIISLIFTYCFRIVDIKGDSMRNTLMHGDRVFISLLGNKLKQGDIVVIQADKAVTLKDDGTLLAADGLHITIVKRIIACEGQTVDIDFSSGAVYVDGERLFEDYVTLGLTHLDEGAFTEKYPVTVPKGYVFVMGDYRSASKDSRSEEIGFVSEDSITGKVLFRFFPNFESLE